MKKSVLLVIDMQEDFCLPDAVLRVQGAMNCLPKVQEAIDKAREAEILVIWIVREHHRSGAGGPLGGLRPTLAAASFLCAYIISIQASHQI
jgi:nicotinamidase-related amidase